LLGKVILLLSPQLPLGLFQLLQQLRLGLLLLGQLEHSHQLLLRLL
jgi:hypothetical protein